MFLGVKQHFIALMTDGWSLSWALAHLFAEIFDTIWLHIHHTGLGHL
jgi:hypothetical protein